MWDAERLPETKFQLPNMFCSGEIKSQKWPIICMGDKFWSKMDGNDIYAKSSPHTNDRRFLGFYFSKTKHVWKLKFGLWGSFAIPNQHDFFRPEIQTRKAPYGDPAFQTPIHPHWGSNRRTLKARNFWSSPMIQKLQSGIWVLLAEAFPTRYGSAIFVTSAYALL
jgi:hypothetical protein